MLDRSRRVILLIDFDNLQICASRDTPGRDLQLEPVVQLAQRYGSVIVARAYAEWNLSTERLAVYKAGIEPAFAPVLRTESDRSGKSLADTVMVAEGMDMLWTLNPDVMVLATSDKDLIPLVRVARQRGCRVVVLGSDYTAIPLREMADEHITYKQLVTDAAGRYVEGPATRAAAATPEPARRARAGRERAQRAAGPAAAPAPTPTPPPAQPAALAAPAPAAGAIEPVPPVALGAETDGQATGRRRRRRGSRRRSDRVGAAEGGESPEEHADDRPVPGTAGDAPEPETAQPPVEPTAGGARTGAKPVPSAGTAAGPGPGASAEPANGQAAPAEPPPLNLTQPPEPAPAAPVGNGPAPDAIPLPPAGEPPSAESGTAAGGGTDAESAAAGSADQAPPPPKRTRARRVASASRGRSRPVSD
jgi:uncharacterized protein (TIGR00288 family)